MADCVDKAVISPQFYRGRTFIYLKDNPYQNYTWSDHRGGFTDVVVMIY